MWQCCFTAHRMVSLLKLRAILSPPCSECNPAGCVAVSGRSSSLLSVNEFGEMVSEIRPLLRPAVCRREMLASTAAFTKDKSSPVKLRLFTSDNDKRKLDETRTRRGSDYAPFSPSEPAIYHRAPQTQGSKKEEEEKSRCAFNGEKERCAEECVHSPIKTPLRDPFPPCSRRIITITTLHTALSKTLLDTSLSLLAHSLHTSTPPSGIASLPPSTDPSLEVSDMSESWAVSSILPTPILPDICNLFQT